MEIEETNPITVSVKEETTTPITGSVKDETILMAESVNEEEILIIEPVKEEKILIFDHGSYSLRAGFSDENTPSISIPSISGKKRTTLGKMSMKPMMGMGMMKGILKPTQEPSDSLENERKFGKEAIEKSNLLRLEHSISNKKDINETTLEMYVHILKTLNAINITKTEEISVTYEVPYKVLYLTSSLADEISLDAISNIFINKLKVKEFAVIPSAYAISKSLNYDSAFVIDLGDDCSEFTAINEGLLVNASNLNLGGCDIMHSLISSTGEEFGSIKYEVIRGLYNLKENNVRCCDSNEKFQEEKKSYQGETVTMNIEGQDYKLGYELLLAGEILFNSELFNKEIKVKTLINKNNVSPMKPPSISPMHLCQNGNLNIPSIMMLNPKESSSVLAKNKLMQNMEKTSPMKSLKENPNHSINKTIAEIFNGMKDTEVRAKVFSKIVICGGTGKTTNIIQRIDNELKKFSPESEIQKLDTDLSEMNWIAGKKLTDNGNIGLSKLWAVKPKSLDDKFEFKEFKSLFNMITIS